VRKKIFFVSGKKIFPLFLEKHFWTGHPSSPPRAKSDRRTDEERRSARKVTGEQTKKGGVWRKKKICFEHRTDFFRVPIWLELRSLLSFFNYWMNQDWVHFNQPGMALTPFPSSVGWYKIQPTHYLSIMNLVCYPLDQAFDIAGKSW